MGIRKQTDGRYRARYRDNAGNEHGRQFKLRKQAVQWLEHEVSKLQTGTWVPPTTARMTVEQWCAQWLAGYGTRKASTVRMAQVHVDKIVAAFGPRRLDSLRPSEIKQWTVTLRAAGYADSYVYALHARLVQVLSDAVHDGVLARSPASRRTSPRAGSQRPYVATTEQVWDLHDAMGERYRAALLLACFSGLRLGEICGLRVADVDFMRGIVAPVQQYPADELKTPMSQTPIPIPESLALTLSAHVARFSAGGWLLTNEPGQQLGPWQLQREFRRVRALVDGLPDGFRFHDLRHYYASLLIASGLDVKVVQTRMRHTSGKTTIDTYGHLWPDSDDTTRAAINSVMTARADEVRTHADQLRTTERRLEP